MVYAFILVKTGPGASPGVLESVGEIDSIVEAHVVAGEFDVILEIDAEAVEDIISFVSGEIQLLDGVLDTKTYVSLD